MNSNQSLQDKVKAFVKGTVSQMNIDWNDEEGRVQSVYNALEIIVGEVTVEKYDFTLAMDVLIETAPKDLKVCLEKILKNSDLDEDYLEKDEIYFAAYYALSIIRKKEGDVDGLFELIGEKYDKFRNFALHFEVHSRYYKRVDNFKKALSCDKLAINVLNSRGVVNVGLCISYASTVCTMLKKRDATLKDSDVELAKKYVDMAIDFNPVYPKYYFLKAQLVFLSAVREKKEISLLLEARDEAITLIDEYADVYLYNIYYNKNRYLEKEREKYEEFKEYIDEIIDRKRSPRFPKTDEYLDERKRRILEADCQDECVSSFILPPIPELHSGDKYFFICYSSKDFKSVYCDLIELYKNKVPFRYDERLTQGLGWQGQIDRGISSEDCAGVVFYLSKNVLSTGSVCEEIEITKKHEKDHFCVNLEGSLLPSQMLTDLLIERHESNKNNYYISGENMKIFLNFFSDNEVFTQKFQKHGDDGTSHLEAYIQSITDKFSEIIIGD